MSETYGATDGDATRRIGDSERHAATEALVVHREAGRLDPVEFEDRQVRVTAARTWAEIQPLFVDLPQPHPVGMPPVTVGTLRPIAQPGTPAVPTAPGQSTGFLGDVVPDRYKSTVMALTPFVALLLFFVGPFRTWLWFLAIPVMGILLYGADGNEERKRQERLARDERRRIERDRRRDR